MTAGRFLASVVLSALSLFFVQSAASDCIYIAFPRACTGACNFCEPGETPWLWTAIAAGCDGGPPACDVYDDNKWNEWVSANAPVNEELCNNPWGGVLDLCDAGPEPQDCRNPDNAPSSEIADPVDVTTGTLEWTPTDLDLGRGLAFTRHYSSSLTVTTGTLGPKWKHGLDWGAHYAVAQVATGGNPLVETVVVRRPLAGPAAFWRETRGTAPEPWKTGTRGAGGLASAADPAELWFTDGDGTRVRFDRTATSPPAYALARIQRPGQPEVFVTHGGPTTTYATGGASLAITRDGSRVGSVTGAGQTWSYGYDGAGCLKTVTGPNPGSPAGDVVWTYSYASSACNLLSKIERQLPGGPNVEIASWTYLDSRVVSIDEPAVDQTLHLTYSPTSPPLTCTVRDAPGTATPALATFTSTGGRLDGVSGDGGRVAIPFVAADYTDGHAAGIPEASWKLRTDALGRKILYENHDARGRPGIVTEGWIDTDLDGLPDPGEYARRREILYHPALDRETQVTEPSLVQAGANRAETYDFDDPVSGEPSALLRRTILTGRTLDASNQPVPFTDETVFAYTTEGRLRSTTGPRPANYTWFDYDPATGARSKVRRHLNGPGSSYLEWTFSNFDARGNPQTVTDPNLRVTTFTYDAKSRVRTVTPPYTDPGSATIGFTYDVDGNLTQADFPADSAGQPVFLRMGYDEKANLLFIADSQQNAIVYEYERSRVTREARYEDFVDYDDRGTLVGDATFEPHPVTGRLFKAFQPAGSSTFAEFEHDPKGNVTGIWDERRREDELLYDALDRLETIRQLRAATYETGFAYDALSNVTQVTDAAGKATDLLHDDRGHLVRTISPDTGTTLFLYDSAGNLVQKIEAFGTPAQRSTAFSYDGLDRLTAIDLPNDPDWVFTYDTSATYNQKGRLASVTNGLVTTELGYTPRGEPSLERTTIDGVAYVSAFEYDAAGNLAEVTTPDLVTATTAYEGLRPSQLTVSDGSSSYAIRSLAWYPFGPRTRAEFPPSDFVGTNTVVSTRQVSPRGQVTRVHATSAAGTILDRSYVYDSAGAAPEEPTDPGPNLDKVTDALDPSESRFFFYDDLDRLEKATDLAGTSLFEYDYDAVGNRTSQVSAAGSITYLYELGTNRLNASLGASLLDYAHDAYGSRIYEGPLYAGTPSLVYDDGNRLVEVRDPASGFATIASYVYDAFGRRVKKTTVMASQTRTFVYLYGPGGQLLQEVEKKAGATDQVRAYVYLEDELVGLVDSVMEVGSTQLWPLPGLRWRDLEGPGWVLLALAGASGLLLLAARRHPAPVTAASSALLVVFTCAGVPRPAALFSWVHTDPLGTPLAVSSTPLFPQDTKVTWRAKYEPFGQATVDEDPDGDQTLLSLAVRFPGQYEDAETGWHYNLFRVYEPDSGRFLEVDPEWQDGSRSDFAYAHLNPTNRIDPSGRYAQAVWLVGHALARAALYVSTAGLAALALDQAIHDDGSAADEPSPPPGSCPPSDCAWLTAEIERALSELRQRYLDLFLDRLDLYHSRPVGKFSRQGHEAQYGAWQARLRSLTQQARAKGCPYNPEAHLWLARGVPQPWWAWIP